MEISVAEAHNHLSSLLKRVTHGPVMISRRGKTVGVLISPEAYEKLRRVQAYLELIDISHELREAPNADEIYRASRDELEGRA
jgi:prevent-host-death family protein